MLWEYIRGAIFCIQNHTFFHSKLYYFACFIILTNNLKIVLISLGIMVVCKAEAAYLDCTQGVWEIHSEKVLLLLWTMSSQQQKNPEPPKILGSNNALKLVIFLFQIIHVFKYVWCLIARFLGFVIPFLCKLYVCKLG